MNKTKCLSVVLCTLLSTVIFTGCACKHKTWNDATCTLPKTCAKCGITEGEPLGHKWKEASCENPKICTVCGETEGLPLGHKWGKADCENPKKCEVCGETLGKPLGHKWSEATCEKAKTCKTCGKTQGKPLGHKWSEATCDEAKTCKTCGKTQGKPLGHKWSEATCDKAKTCTICGKTQGEPLKHQWVDATCEKPKTCKLCGKTEGEKLKHQWVDATCEKPKTCKLCGKKEGSTLKHKYQNGYCINCKAKDPNYIFLSDVKSIDKLQEYLKQSYSSIDTPYGKISVDIKIDYPKTNSDKSLYGYDMYIKCDADFMIENPTKKITEYDWVDLPWDLDSLNVTDSERQKMVNIMKDYQSSIAKDAMTCFPSSFIMGGFYDFTSSGLTISDDYVDWHDSDITRYFTWTNYVGTDGEHSYYENNRDYITLSKFGWAPDGDDKWYGYND